MNRIKELRQEKGLTLRQLSEKTGIRDNTISQYETGKRRPKEINLYKLADFFDVLPLYLMGESNIKNEHEFANYINEMGAMPNFIKILEDEDKKAKFFHEASSHDEFADFQEFQNLYANMPILEDEYLYSPTPLKKLNVKKMAKINRGTEKVFELYVKAEMGNEKAKEIIEKIEELIN